MGNRAPYMRLVGGHAPEELEGSEELELMAAKAQEGSEESQPTEARAPRRRKRTAVAAAAAEGVAEASEVANECPDGEVIDANGEASDDLAICNGIAIDLPALEALLFSTHH